MIDIHCHILPKVDDGAKTLEDALEMARTAHKDGIKTIINTSHFHTASNYVISKELKAQLEQFNEILKENNIDISVLIGNELYYNADLIYELDKEEFFTLNESRYVLIEFGNNTSFEDIEEAIFELKLRNLIPILAHIERNVDMQHINEVHKFINQGALIQINSSFLNLDKKDRELIDIMLTHEMVHFIATDAHSPRRRPPKLRESYNYVTSLIGKEKADNIFINNTNKVINDEEVIIISPKKHAKKGLFSRIINL